MEDRGSRRVRKAPKPAAAAREEDGVAAVVDALVHELQPQKVILFGSAARGELQPDSDLDVMVIVPHLSQDLNEVTRAYRAIAAIKERQPVDVLVFSRQDMEEWRGVIGHVINDALTEGRIIYDSA